MVKAVVWTRQGTQYTGLPLKLVNRTPNVQTSVEQDKIK